MAHKGTYYVQGSLVHVQCDAGTKATQLGRLPAMSVAKLLLSVGARTAEGEGERTWGDPWAYRSKPRVRLIAKPIGTPTSTPTLPLAEAGQDSGEGLRQAEVHIVRQHSHTPPWLLPTCGGFAARLEAAELLRTLYSSAC